MSLIGYARVSTRDQNAALQREALAKAGCDRVFEEAASGAQRERPQLMAALDYVRAGDTLIVWKLDRLARSLKQLIETVEELDDATSAFVRSPRPSTPRRRRAAGVSDFRRIGRIRARVNPRADARRFGGARAQGRFSGRPTKITEKDIQAAKALLSGTDLTVEEAARRVGVSPATLYRHLPAARAAVKGEA